MIAFLFRVLIVGLIVVAIAGGVGLFIMAGIAGIHDVVPIPVPSTSYLAVYQGKVDYIDAYRGPMELNFYRDIDRVAERAFHKGDRELYRDENEVVYEGSRCGMTYRLAYLLERGTGPATLTVVTAVTITEKKGRYFWTVLRPMHKRIIPYMLDKMIQAAPD